MTARVRRLVALIWSGGALLFLMLFVLDARQPGQRPVLKVTGVDSVVYYSVARSLLFDRDVDLRNEFAVMEPEPGDWRAPVPRTGLPAILFPIGFSLVQIPFLAAASLVDWLRGVPVNGYSRTCVAAWYLGIIVFLSAGLSALFLWLRHVGAYFDVTERTRDYLAFAATVAIWPSTTLGYYTVSPLSHVAAFAATAVFLLVWMRARGADPGLAVRRWIWVGVAAGFATLCRWQEVLLLLLPLIWDAGLLWHAGATAGGWRRWLQSRAAAAAAFVLVLTPQLLEWRAVYGTWLTIPQGEGFVSFPPRFVPEVLFSSFNGWFTWTPITIVGVCGLLWGLRRAPRLFAPLLAVLAAEIVLVGGVLTWHGHWFGLRYLTSMATLIAAGLFCLACSVRLKGRTVLACLAAACTAFTLLFAVQYRTDLIPKMSRLTTDELLWDKVHLPSAYQRRDRALEAARALERNDPEAALEIAERACVQLGASARLLEIRIAASRTLGEDAALARAVEDQQRYDAARLF